jgi:hypothetical protein
MRLRSAAIPATPRPTSPIVVGSEISLTVKFAPVNEDDSKPISFLSVIRHNPILHNRLRLLRLFNTRGLVVTCYQLMGYVGELLARPCRLTAGVIGALP